MTSKEVQFQWRKRFQNPVAWPGKVFARKAGIYISSLTLIISITMISTRLRAQETIPVESVEFLTQAITISQGSTLQLKAQTLPEGSNGTLTYEISSNGSANTTLTPTGLLTAGTTNGSIKVKAVYTGSVTRSATVTITVGTAIPVTDILATAGGTTSAKLSVGGSKQQIDVAYLPSNTNQQGVSYTSSNTDVVTVTSKGVMTATGDGSATVTVASLVDPSVKSDITVNIIPYVEVTGIEFITPSITIGTEDTFQLVARTLPAGSEGVLTYKTTSNTAAFTTVSTSGLLITGSSKGKTTVEATYINGTSKFTKSLNLSIGTVYPIKGISASVGGKTSIQMPVGETTQQIDLMYDPDTTNQKGVSYSSSDTNVAKVSSTGSISTVAEGKSTISVVSLVDASIRQDIEVSVVPYVEVTGIEFITPSITVGIEDTLQLVARTLPAGSNGIITFRTTSNTAAFTNVSTNGLFITGTQSGETTVEASYTNGTEKLTAQLKLIVGTVYPITGLTVSAGGKKSINMPLGESSMQVELTYTPDTTNQKGVRYSSSDITVAKVSQTGVVSAVAEGTTYIKATSLVNESVSDSIEVTIIPYVEITGIEFITQPTTLGQLDTLQVEARTLPVGSNGVITFKTSSNTAAFTKITSSGLLTTGNSNGKTTVEAKYTNGTTTFTQMLTIMVFENVAVTGISALVGSSSSIEITTTETSKQVNLSFEPSNTTEKNVVYQSKDTSIATVSSTGLIHAVGSGTTYVVVSSASTPGVKDSIEVKVFFYITDIGLSAGTISFKNGDSTIITAVIAPSNATKKEVQLEATPAGIVTIKQINENTFMVTGEATGEVSVVAKANDGSLTESAAIKLTVVDTTIAVESVTINPVNTITAGDTTTLTAKVSPSNATNKAIKWTSNAPEIASIDENTGLLTAITSGTVKITAYSHSGAHTVTTITVKEAVEITGIEFITKPTTLGYEDTLQIEARTLPEGSNGMISYKTQSNTAAYTTITSSGLLTTGTSNGKTTVEATYKKGTTVFTAQLNITVMKPEPITGLEATVNGKTDIEIYAGDTTKTIAIAYTPSNTTEKGCAFTSDQPTVVAVSENGKLIVLKGSSTPVVITATSTANASISSKVTVHALEKVSTISLNSSSNTLKIDSSMTIYVSVLNNSATNKNVAIEVSDSTIVALTVSDKITIKGLKEGTVSLIAKALDGSNIVSTPLSITVEKAQSTEILVSSIVISTEWNKLEEGTSKQLEATVYPLNATYRGIIWTSSNTDIATIDNTGMVAAKKAGNVIIVARSIANETKTDSISIEITKKVIPQNPDTITITKQFKNIVVSADSAATKYALSDFFDYEGLDSISFSVSTSDSTVLKPVLKGTSDSLSLIANKAGKATVTVTVKMGTKDSVTQSFDITVKASSTSDDEKSNDVSLSPNPARKHTVIKLPNDKVSKVTICNLLGSKVLTLEGKGTTTIDCSTFGTGVYSVTVSTGKTISTKKLIVE